MGEAAGGGLWGGQLRAAPGERQGAAVLCLELAGRHAKQGGAASGQRELNANVKDWKDVCHSFT